MAPVIYNLLLMLISPMFLLFFLYRILVSGKSKGAWRQQIGLMPELPPRRDGVQRVWIQAVSVGETVASVPVFKALRALMPDAELILSTTTTTGQGVAKKSVPEADFTLFFPIDYPAFAWMAIKALKPDVFVTMESEIWPNFLMLAKRRGAKTAIVNAIVSDKTMKRSGAFRWLYKWAFSNVDVIYAQSEQDKMRLLELGASPEKVSVQGNCKFDEPIRTLLGEEKSSLKEMYRFAQGDPVFVAGSTNPGEDQPVIDAFTFARKAHPALRMIIAPRQIERAEEIIGLVSNAGFKAGRRSKREELEGDEDVVILDTLGELAMVYSIADVAFVGGTLIEKGGHNILQPIAHGKPVYVGPYTFKCRDLLRIAREAGVAFQVADADELGREISRSIGNSGWLEEISSRAEGLMSNNRGVSARCAQLIRELAEKR